MPSGIQGIPNDAIRPLRPDRIQEIGDRRNPQQKNGSCEEQKREKEGKAPEEERKAPNAEHKGGVDILV